MRTVGFILTAATMLLLLAGVVISAYNAVQDGIRNETLVPAYPVTNSEEVRECFFNYLREKGICDTSKQVLIPKMQYMEAMDRCVQRANLDP